ncbi:MAG: NADAR family protein, partial [Lachnospiraceae bacterium]|nr:NADAR family protein [Lachnospiraceae bacterium]
MSKKAVLFHDAVTNTKILRADTALECRDLGREIRPFDPAVWDAEKIGIVTQGNRLKYTQHPELLEQLLATGDTCIAEANPTEKIWGIGVDRETAETMDRSAWPGTNLQGELLMRLREELRNGSQGERSDA